MGKAALAELAFAPDQWQNAYWAKDKGLYARVFENTKDLDEALSFHLNKLSKYNPEALARMKAALWEGSEDWEKLLPERADISGELVLSDFVKKTLQKFRK